MLAYCVQCGLPKETYLDYDHPLQQAIRRAVAHFTSTPEADLVAGIDGCSAPNYAVPLERLALAFARLAARHDDAVFGPAPQILADAMTAHPEMVSGERRSDLELMRAGRGDWVAKIGAEGVQGIGLRGAGIGIAIKIADGNKRALRPVMAAVLDQLGLLDARCRAELARWFEPVIRNHRGIVTGTHRVVALSWTNRPTASVARCCRIAITLRRDELPSRSVVCRCKRAPHGAPDEAMVRVRGAWGLKPDAAPAVRRA